VALLYAQLTDLDDVAAILPDPVVPGDAPIEDAFAHVPAHLLGPQAHELDFLIIDDRLVVPLGVTNVEPGLLKQVGRGLLQTSGRNAELQDSFLTCFPYRCRTSAPVLMRDPWRILLSSLCRLSRLVSIRLTPIRLAMIRLAMIRLVRDSGGLLPLTLLPQESVELERIPGRHLSRQEPFDLFLVSLGVHDFVLLEIPSIRSVRGMACACRDVSMQ